MQPVTRYHPVLVTLHWLLAILILGALFVGFVVFDEIPNSDPQKIAILRLHMAGGMLILALMVIRFIVRLRTAKPPEVLTGYPLLDKIAPVVHYAFYLIVILTVAAGYTTGIIAGLPAIVFGNSGAPLPEDFDIYLTFQAHGFFAGVLLGLIVLHTAAAFYHQFVLKDGLFKRMFYGRRL